MFKRFFQSDSSESEPRPEEARMNGAHGSAKTTGSNGQRERASAPFANGYGVANPGPDFFEHVYENALVKRPLLNYDILNVAEMASSPHLAGMSLDLKRNSILMALDASGTEIDRVLEDAVFRQRALNDHEEAMQKALREFETSKSDEVSRIRAELDDLTAQHMARIQANLDDVAREQDNLRDWQKRKQHECQRIADAAMFCVPKSQPVNDAFATLLERGATTTARRAEVNK